MNRRLREEDFVLPTEGPSFDPVHIARLTPGNAAIGGTHVRIRFPGYPSDCVDASDTCVILGALDTYGEKGHVRIERIDNMNAELGAQW